MTDRSDIETVALRLARYWPVVIAAMAAGALLLGGYEYLTAPDPGYAGNASVRVLNLTGNASAPTPETFAAAAVLPSTRDEALEELGTTQGAGVVSSQVDVKDKTVVDIRALHADKDTALRYAEAVRSIATSESLATLSQWIDSEQARLASYEAEIQRIDADIANMTRLQQSADAKDSISAAATLSSLRSTRFGLSEQVRDIRMRVVAYTDGVSDFGEPSVSREGNGREILLAAGQGALVGLIVGLVFAFFADMLRRRRAA